MARGADKACYCERCLLGEELGFAHQQVHEPEAFGSDEREVEAQHEEDQEQEEEQEHASSIAEVEPQMPCAPSQEHERMTVAQVTAACVQTLLHWHLCLRYWGIPDRSCENPHRWWCSDLSTWCEAFASEACGVETGEKQVDQKVLDSQACAAGAEPERELEQEQEFEKEEEQVEELPRQTDEMNASALERLSIPVQKRPRRMDRHQRRRLEKASAVKGDLPVGVVDTVEGVHTESLAVAVVGGGREGRTCR